METSRFGSKLAKDLQVGERVIHPITRKEELIERIASVGGNTYMRVEFWRMSKAVLIPVNHVVTIS